MEFIKDFGIWLWAVLSNWAGWSGGVIAALIALWYTMKQRNTPIRLSIALVSIFFFLACFTAWREEYRKAQRGLIHLSSRMAPLNKRDPFPTGRVASFNVFWSVIGNVPALNVHHRERLYLRPNTERSTQMSVINEFKQWWETEAKDFLPEAPSLIPGDEMFSTARDRVLSDSDRARLRDGTLIVYVLGAARFNDSAGVHEAHTCKYLEMPKQDIQQDAPRPGEVTVWQTPMMEHYCVTYNSQVDVK